MSESSRKKNKNKKEYRHDLDEEVSRRKDFKRRKKQIKEQDYEQEKEYSEYNY